MPWQFFLAINIFAYSVTTLLQKVLIKNQNSRPITYTIFFLLFTGIIVSLVGVSLHAITFPEITPVILVNLVLGTFLYAFGNVYIFKALKATEASKFTIIYSTRVAFTVLVSVMFLGELFSLKDILGAVLIFIGIVIVSIKSARIALNKGDVYSFIAAILYGLANANARFLLHTFYVFPYMLFVFFTPVLLLAIIYPKEIQHAKLFLKGRNFFAMCIVSVIYAIANIAFFEALKLGPSASLVSTVVLVGVIVTVILSIIFLHERENIGRKLLGALISFIGLVILSL